MSCSQGVDLATGKGLDAALAGRWRWRWR